MGKYTYCVGDKVEVAGDAEEGFAGSFSVATIVSESKDGNFKIQYDSFVDEAGQLLAGKVHKDSPDLRPAPPSEVYMTTFQGCEEGQCVEVFEKDCWWKSVVVGCPPAGIQVQLIETDDSVTLIRNIKFIRRAYDWYNGAWYRRFPDDAGLRHLGLQKLRNKIAQEQRDAQPLQQPPRTAAPIPKVTPGVAGPSRADTVAPPSNHITATKRSGQRGKRSYAEMQGFGGAAPKGAKPGPTSPKSSSHPLPTANMPPLPAAALAGNPHLAGPSTSAFPPLPTFQPLMPLLPLQPGAPNFPPGAPHQNGSAVASTSAAATAPTQPARARAAPQQQPDEDVEVRRSSRAPKNRLVYVNGLPVLKSNMYDLDAGEPSVFDRELGSEAALMAQQGVSLTDPAIAAAAASRARAALHPKVPREAKPRVLDAMALSRMEHNQTVRAESQAMESIRAAYMMSHIDKLSPFITPQAHAHITAKALSADPSWAPPEAPTAQPDCIQGVMREYQLEGLAWLVSKFDHGVNAILADEMGLGKTLQTISFLSYLKTVRGVDGPHLVVVPLSVLPSWMSEFRRWCPTMRVVRLHSTDIPERHRLRREVLANPSSFDVAVTTYEMVKSQEFGNALKTTITWRYVIMDEAHKVKNEESLISQEMRRISCGNVLMLTGTPVQNNMHELFALLSFLYPDVFTDSSLFDRAFDLIQNKVDDTMLEAAHYLMRPFCLRRLKTEVEVSLPPKTETRISCPLLGMQTFWYRRLLVRDARLLLNMEGEEQEERFAEGGDSWRKALNLLMQLRKVCNHPFLFPDAEPGFDGLTTDEDIVEASGKMKVLDRLLGKLKPKGHRVVLFSQFNIMLDIIEDYLRMRGYKYRRLDGSINRVQRMVDMEQFNKPNSDIFIFILNTRAGGLGVNLQTADTCILYDSDWNPQWDLQAMARVHRIGQTKPVHIYRLCTEGTVEERVQARAEQKLYLDQMVNRGSTAQAEQLEKLGRKELLNMLKFGADRIFKSEQGRGPSDQQLDKIIDRTPRPDGNFQNEDEGIADCKHSAGEFKAEEAPVSSLLFKGVDYTQYRSANGSLRDIAHEYWEQRKRDRKERLVMVDGFAVLRENNYSMQAGGISVLDGRDDEPFVFKKERKKRQRPGVDFPHMDTCQVCWDGGELVCCDLCPCAYHPHCVGLSPKELKLMRRWTCPQHACSQCSRKAQAAGGLLFRCEMCENAFCEDHLPADHQVTGEHDLFKSMGQEHPTTACFLLCSEGCQQLRQRMDGHIQALMDYHASAPDRSQLVVGYDEDEAAAGTGPAAAKKAAPAPDSANKRRPLTKQEEELRAAQIEAAGKKAAASAARLARAEKTGRGWTPLDDLMLQEKERQKQAARMQPFLGPRKRGRPRTRPLNTA